MAEGDPWGKPLARGQRGGGRQRPADGLAAVAVGRPALAPARRRDRAALRAGSLQSRPTGTPVGPPADRWPGAGRAAPRWRVALGGERPHLRAVVLGAGPGRPRRPVPRGADVPGLPVPPDAAAGRGSS